MYWLIARDRIATGLLLVAPIVTLAISPFSSFDPINLIKMLVLSSVSFYALMLIISNLQTVKSMLPRGLWLATFFFLIWMIVVLLLADAPVGQQFWGTFGRNNGLLAYSSLILILISAALVQKKDVYHKLVVVLILTAIPTTLYSVIQLAGYDPIIWSEMAPFATLGNINFASAFFGLASICATTLALAPKQRITIRVALIILVATDLYIVVETGSIQGLMIYIAGIGIVGYFLVRSNKSMRVFQIPYIAVGLAGFILTVLALRNSGPLARFIFGDTILYRFDYWYAGWAMTLSSPIVGVGLDSYGDWYRELRGEIATLRTSPDRITNTAHNIYLDISASGGFPLLLAYLVVLGYALVAAVRVIRRGSNFNPYFVALFATWVAYLIQAAISINQIGVGVWGWLFSGALIGYEISTRNEGLPSPGRRRSRTEVIQLPISMALLGVMGFAAGFILSFIPFNADSEFREATQTGSARDQFEQSKALGSTGFHMELALDASIKSGDESLAREIIDEMLKRNPRGFMGWRVLQALASSTPTERDNAYQQLRRLDPYNPDIERIE